MDYRNYSALQTVGRIMARNYGINIRFQGSGAYTDGKTINLPMLVDAPQEILNDLRGFLDHEVAHCKFTEFEEIIKCKNTFHRHFLNGIEDERIERLLPLEFPGTQLNIDRMNEKLTALLEEKYDSFPWPIRFIIACREVYNYRKPKLDEQLELVFLPLLPQIEELRNCRTTKEIRVLTGEIIDALNLLRKGLGKDAVKLTAEELEQFNGMMNDVPLALGDDEEEGEAVEAKGNLNLDPSVDEKKGKSGNGEADDETDAKSKSGDGEDGSQGKEANEGEGTGSEGDGADADGDASESGKVGEGEKSEDTDGASSKMDGMDASGDASGDDVSSAIGEDSDGSASGDGDFDASSEDSEFGGDPSGATDGLSPDGDSKSKTKNTERTWTETKTESSMVEETDERKDSEWKQHPFSTETMVEKELEEHFENADDIEEVEDAYDGEYTGSYKSRKVSLPFSTQFDYITDYSGRGNLNQYSAEKREVLPLINPLKSAFIRMLQSEENKRMRFDRERGQINRKALTSVIADGNFNRPFREFTKEITDDVAVSLVIDCSGSMRGDKIHLARLSAIALSETLKALDMEFEVVGFTTKGSPELRQAVSEATSRGENLSRFNRTNEALDLFVFKSFSCPKMVGITNATSHNSNGDSESILWAGQRLAEREEGRKLMFVLSDGQPAMNVKDYNLLHEDLRRVVNTALPDMGIEVFGIGIQTNAVEQYYKDHIVVNNLKSLPQVVLTQLMRMVMKSWEKKR